MCGINGVFWYRGGQADARVTRAQAAAQRHRGPDDADV
jgi:asparagine synthetase B (glutamine-hydrolysing)